MKKFAHPQRVFHGLFIFFLLMMVSSFSFSQTVTGTVTDDINKPLSGVTQMVKGTKRSALSANLFNNNPAGGFIRRLSYPDYESSNNKANYFAAVQANGGTDNLTTRVFWDKP